MTTLDELFGAALEREAMPASQERREAVADVAVRGARRRRRVTTAVQTLSVVVVVALGAMVGSRFADSDSVEPADPTPVASTTSTPIVEIKAQGTTFADEDPRMALEPAMTAADWAAVDASWDVEFASLMNPDGVTSTVQWYLTGADGDRKFAYVDREFPLLVPQLLAFDPGTRTALVVDEDSKTFTSVVVGGGPVSEIQWELESQLQSGSALGRAADGSSVFVLNVIDPNGAAAAMVSRMSGDTGAGIIEGPLSASAVWGNWLVVREGDAMSVIDLGADSGPTEYPDLAGCEFAGWTKAGLFDVRCGVDDDRAARVLEVDPATGDHTTIATDVSTSEGYDAEWIPEHAIDSTRTLTGPYEADGKTVPPTVWDGGDEPIILATGFFPFPDTYTVIFGARP